MCELWNCKSKLRKKRLIVTWLLSFPFRAGGSWKGDLQAKAFLSAVNAGDREWNIREHVAHRNGILAVLTSVVVQVGTVRDGGTAGAVSLVELRADTGMIARISALAESGVLYNDNRITQLYFCLCLEMIDWSPAAEKADLTNELNFLKCWQRILDFCSLRVVPITSYAIQFALVFLHCLAIFWLCWSSAPGTSLLSWLLHLTKEGSP